MVQKNMPTYRVETPQRCYSAIVERGVIGQAAQYIPAQDREGLRRHHGRRLAACRRARCGRRSTGLPYEVLHLPGGEDQKRLAPRGRAGRADGAASARDRSSMVIAFGGGIVTDMARIPRRHLHARHSGDADSHHAAGAGGCGNRRQDRRQSGERQESDRQLPPAARRADRSRRAGHPARARIPRRPVRNHQGRHHSRARAVPLPRRTRARTCWRASRQRWTTSSPNPCA